MPNLRVPGGTRRRILSTARELFSAHTYRATSMREIAERVGITKASLYHHFSSKGEILVSLVGPPIDRLAEGVDAAAAEPDLDRGRRLLLENCVDAMLDHRETMALLRDPSVYADNNPETARMMHRVVGLIERAAELLAGPDADWRQRVRAAQAFAAVTDPITHVARATGVPDAELRAELLRGAAAVLGHD